MKRTNGPCSAARLLGVLIAIAQCALPVAAQDDCTPQVAGRYVPATPWEVYSDEGHEDVLLQ